MDDLDDSWLDWADHADDDEDPDLIKLIILGEPDADGNQLFVVRRGPDGEPVVEPDRTP